MNSRKRVLVQINSATLRGTEINAVDLAAGVAEYGYDSAIVAPRDTFRSGHSLLDVARAKGIDIEAFDRPGSTVEGARTMRHLAKRHGADLVHVYGSWSHRPAYWGPCFLGGRPLVMTVYEMKVNADTAGNGAELVIGTRYLLEEIQNRRGGVHLVSPPVDLTRDDPAVVDAMSFLAHHEISADQPRVVIVSRLDKDLKGLGIELAMQACEQLAATDLQLIIVGGGDAENKLHEMADAINERNGRTVIHMVGPMADPRPAYACADIVIGMGGSAARGLAFAKPLIVAGEFGWFKTFAPETEAELFRNSFWSDQVSRDPVGDLVQSLRALLESPVDRSRLAEHGRRFAEGNFGLKQMAIKLAGIYDKAIANYGPINWLSDIPLEIGFLGRRFTSRRGYRPLMLHTPPPSEVRATSIQSRE